MLKKIIIDNYKTFTQPTTIDLEATNYRFLDSTNVAEIGNRRILKGALFVGANASGKTSILDAICILMQILFSESYCNYSQQRSFYTNRKTFSVTYEFSFCDDDLIYELEFNDNGIYTEKLHVNKREVLERDTSTNTYRYNKNTMMDFSIPASTSFLKWLFNHSLIEEKSPIKKMLSYIGKSILVSCMAFDSRVCADADNPKIPNSYKAFIDERPDAINSFFKAMGYNFSVNTKKRIGIDNITNSDSLDNKLVVMRRKGTTIDIPLDQESSGNKVLVKLLPYFIAAIENDCMLLVDEFSSGLENKLEEYIVKYFFDETSKRKVNSQIILVSHSTNILNNAILRPDQEYNVLYDLKSGAHLKRFSEQNPREAQNVEKMYLSGVFN